MRPLLLLIALCTAPPPLPETAPAGTVDCKKVKTQCIDECTKKALPTKDHGFRFFRCLNACMEQHGCLGKA